MPTVIGLNQVPANIPRQTGWDYYGAFQGTQARQLTDALLAAMLGSGNNPFAPKYPNPQYGQSSLPQVNPGVQMQPYQSQNPLAPPQNVQQVKQQYTTTPPPSLYPNRPELTLKDIEAAQAMANIRQTQAQTQSLNPEYQAELFRRTWGMPPTTQSGTQPSGADNEFLQGLSTLSAKAEAGDEQAVQRIRMIRQLLQAS